MSSAALKDRPNVAPHDPIHMLELSDLSMLLSLEPFERIGRIIQLNRDPRYNYRLNVVELLVQLAELRRDTRHAVNELRGTHATSPVTRSSGFIGLDGNGRTDPNSFDHD